MALDLGPLLSVLSNIRDTGEFSDLEVKCGSSSFKVHGCIVCPQSGFFRGALRHDCEETRSGVVTISDDPSIVSKMFDYFYCADYDDSPETSDMPSEKEEKESEARPAVDSEHQDATPETLPSHWRRARVNVQVYVIADKYMIDGLKGLSRRKLRLNMEGEWNETGFLDVVRDVYGPEFPAESELCDMLALLALQHVSTLKESQHFHQVRKDYPQFGYDFSTLLMERIVELESLGKAKVSLCEGNPQPSSYTDRSPARTFQRNYCTECRRSFVSSSSLRQHDTDYHSWCTDCNRTFSSRSKAQQHRFGVHGGY